MRQLVLLWMLATLATGLLDEHYCGLRYRRLCQGKGHHVACNFPETGPAPSCERYTQIDFTKELQHFITNYINRRRQRVAAGNERVRGGVYVPKPQIMMLVGWDRELAVLAQRLADQCSFVHDDCRATVRYPYAGQTVGEVRWRRYRDSEALSAQRAIRRVLDAWWGERRRVKVAQLISPFRFDSKGTVWGHFTQLTVWNLQAVGCGAVRHGATYPRLLLVCDFSHTNMLGQKTLLPGNTAPCPMNTIRRLRTAYPMLCGPVRVSSSTEAEAKEYYDEPDTWSVKTSVRVHTKDKFLTRGDKGTKDEIKAEHDRTTVARVHTKDSLVTGEKSTRDEIIAEIMGERTRTEISTVKLEDIGKTRNTDDLRTTYKMHTISDISSKNIEPIKNEVQVKDENLKDKMRTKEDVHTKDNNRGKVRTKSHILMTKEPSEPTTPFELEMRKQKVKKKEELNNMISLKRNKNIRSRTEGFRLDLENKGFDFETEIYPIKYTTKPRILKDKPVKHKSIPLTTLADIEDTPEYIPRFASKASKARIDTRPHLRVRYKQGQSHGTVRSRSGKELYKQHLMKMPTKEHNLEDSRTKASRVIVDKGSELFGTTAISDERTEHDDIERRHRWKLARDRPDRPGASALLQTVPGKLLNKKIVEPLNLDKDDRDQLFKDTGFSFDWRMAEG